MDGPACHGAEAVCDTICALCQSLYDTEQRAAFDDYLKHPIETDVGFGGLVAWRGPLPAPIYGWGLTAAEAIADLAAIETNRRPSTP